MSESGELDSDPIVAFFATVVSAQNFSFGEKTLTLLYQNCNSLLRFSIAEKS